MKKVKEWWQRFRQWQREPMLYKELTNEKYICQNCGLEFVGDFCPRCSQSAKVGKKIGWDTIGLSFMDAFNFNTRSLPRSLWHLICRPGYLISDYISGRRQMSYPPMKLLLIVAICIVFIDTLSEWMGWNEVTEEVTAGDGMVESISKWVDANPGWVMLAICSLFILPTWLFFRYAPRRPHHTLPEGFIIQLFMTTLILLIIILCYLSNWFLCLAPIYYIIAYRQLFGYGLWGTTWRIFAILFEIFLFLLITVMLVGIGIHNTLGPRTIVGLIILMVVMVLIGAAVAAIVNRINKIRTGSR